MTDNLAAEQQRYAQKHPYAPLAHDGKTPAAWVSSIIAGIGFIVAAIGFVLPGINVPVIVAGFVLVAASAIVGGVMHKMGLGVRELDAEPRR